MALENEEVLNQAVFGRQVEDFLSSDVGRYLLEKSEERYIMALTGLKTVVPTDTGAIERLQNEARWAESFRTWLMDAVTDGLRAKQILEERVD